MGILMLLLALLGCASPIHQATYHRYMEAGGAAEKAGEIDLAAENFSRALTNVQWGNLGPAAELEAAYNLGRMRRLQGKTSESEDLLERALELSLDLREHELLTGMIRIELSRAYLEGGKIEEGGQVMTDLLPVVGKYGEDAVIEDFLAETYRLYAAEFDLLGRASEAKVFRDAAERRP